MSIRNLSLQQDARFICFYKENINILIYVANEIEFESTINFLEQNNTTVVSFIDNDNLYYVAKIGLYPIVLVKGGCIGQLHIGACDTIINRALATFNNIKYLVTIGVCGATSKKVSIGDVIIANEIIDYESQKIQEDHIIDRSQGLFLSSLNNIIASKIGLMKFTEFKVHFGKILSGNKLMDSKLGSKQLISLHEEAIALDMEGYAISRLAISNKLTDWIFIKSASDRTYNKRGSTGQDKCMQHVLTVLSNLFSQPGIFETSKIKVMISGSYVFGDALTETVENLSYALTQKLIDANYKIVSGYGKCVGNAVVAGAYNSHSKLQNADGSIQDYIEIYPFPRIENKKIVSCLENIKFENRQLMLKDCSFCILIYGKKDSGELATGMDDEFRLASKTFVVPVGCTGFKAEELWKKVKDDFNYYYPTITNIENKYESLNDKSLTTNEVVDRIIDFMNSIKNCYFEFE